MIFINLESCQCYPLSHAVIEIMILTIYFSIDRQNMTLDGFNVRFSKTIRHIGKINLKIIVISYFIKLIWHRNAVLLVKTHRSAILNFLEKMFCHKKSFIRGFKLHHCFNGYGKIASEQNCMIFSETHT